jgi:hypothetical protein
MSRQASVKLLCGWVTNPIAAIRQTIPTSGYCLLFDIPTRFSIACTTMSSRFCIYGIRRGGLGGVKDRKAGCQLKTQPASSRSTDRGLHLRLPTALRTRRGGLSAIHAMATCKSIPQCGCGRAVARSDGAEASPRRCARYASYTIPYRTAASSRDFQRASP